MRISKASLPLLAFLCCQAMAQDIVIYGGTPGGISAATFPHTMPPATPLKTRPAQMSIAAITPPIFSIPWNSGNDL
jgi:hypothetical protein